MYISVPSQIPMHPFIYSSISCEIHRTLIKFIQVLLMNRILRLPEVMHLTGLSRSTIYSKITQGEFPKQINLGGRSVGWSEKAVLSWIDECLDGNLDDAVA